MYSHHRVCVFYTFTVKTEQQSNAARGTLVLWITVSKSQTPWTDRTQQQETRQSNYISTVSHRQISPSRRRSEDVLFKLFWRRKQAMLRSVDAAVGQCSREQQRTTEEDHGSPDYCPTTGQPDVVWMDRRGSQKQDWTANSKANWRFPKYV